MTPEHKKRIYEALAGMTQNALRVLALGMRQHASDVEENGADVYRHGGYGGSHPSGGKGGRCGIFPGGRKNGDDNRRPYGYGVCHREGAWASPRRNGSAFPGRNWSF